MVPGKRLLLTWARAARKAAGGGACGPAHSPCGRTPGARCSTRRDAVREPRGAMGEPDPWRPLATRSSSSHLPAHRAAGHKPRFSVGGAGTCELM